MTKGFAPIVLVLVILGIVALGGASYVVTKNLLITKAPSQPRVCPQIAKLCPDGKTYVSPTGPNCEFSACPEVKNATSTWQTYRNDEYGFEVKYPPDWTKKELSYEVSFSKDLSIDYFAVELRGATTTFLSIDDWFSDAKPKLNIVSSEKIAVDGYPAIRYAPAEGIGNWKYITVFKNGKLYGLHYLDNDKQINSQILSTFKFIEPANTTGWKTYKTRNDTAEFKYPEFNKGYGPYAIDISFVNGENFDTWISKNKSLYGGTPDYIPNSVTKFTINGLRGEKRYFNLVAGQRIELMITNEKRLLIVDINTNGITKPNLDLDTLLNGIISTTKFLSLPVIDPSTWKIFNSTKYSFSFKYPSDWTAAESNDGVVTLSSPETQKIIEGTSGEQSDQVYFSPNESTTTLSGSLLLKPPVSFSEQYFSSQDGSLPGNWSGNKYLGKIIIDGKTAFQFEHSEMGDDKYTIMQNPDSSLFIISAELGYSLINYSDDTKIEPYDTILSTFKFTK